MPLSDCNILVTGANGFIGRNLVLRLHEMPGVSVTPFVRGDDLSCIPTLLPGVDFVIHLAGVNRPSHVSYYSQVNYGLTSTLCNAIYDHYRVTGRHIPFIFVSSVQVYCDNPYGRSKLEAENALHALAQSTGNPSIIFRLPGVFGKWCKPNYNSVVATFCYNLARDLPITINNPNVSLPLVYIDDVVDALLGVLENPRASSMYPVVTPEYTTTVGDLALQITKFRDCRKNLFTQPVGTGFLRALYATYVSYLPINKFSYEVPQYTDSRGVFVEILKSPEFGQVSFFTLGPGITRGGHYHHTKTEKFLILSGKARFRFRHLLSGELREILTLADKPEIVDTVPGWSHDITNISDVDMFVVLWSNEVFERERPDTYPCPL